MVPRRLGQEMETCERMWREAGEARASVPCLPGVRCLFLLFLNPRTMIRDNPTEGGLKPCDTDPGCKSTEGASSHDIGQGSADMEESLKQGALGLNLCSRAP